MISPEGKKGTKKDRLKIAYSKMWVEKGKPDIRAK